LPESASADPSSGNVNEPPSFEHSLAELEAIVHALEDGQLGLADSLTRYEQAIKHLRHCHQLLQAAEQKIELLTGVADDGTPCTEPFDQPTESLEQSAGKRRKSKGNSKAGEE
jgi:exodeoxyribonuclease VII small subunit